MERRIRFYFLQDVLGGRAFNENILTSWIEGKAPEGKNISDEIANRGIEDVVENKMTGFSKEQGCPHIWDYQIKGFLKEAMGALKKLPNTESSKQKAHKKAVDNYIFFDARTSRKIFFHNADGSRVNNSQLKEEERSLRASTMQGERVSIARSESVPAGTYVEFDMIVMDESLNKAIDECFNYGRYKGFGQWRNAGFGTFMWMEFDKAGNVIAGNLIQARA